MFKVLYLSVLLFWKNLQIMWLGARNALLSSRIAELTPPDDYPHCDKIHNYFGLTYASYDVLPRLVLDDLPEFMQDKYLEVREYIDENYDNTTWISDYVVTARDNGKFIKDPLSDYRRGSVKQFRRKKQ